MKDNQAKYPQLRFKGFTDPWEERKLSSISERVTRKNKNNESTLPLTISAQDGLVDQNDFFNKQVASRDVTGYFLVKNGEFAYNKSYSNGYPWGAIKRLDKYDMGVLSTLYIVFRPTKINSQFLVSYYDTTRWYREVSKNAAEGARNHGLLNIAPTDFFNTLLVVPKIVDEQQKIGSFFKQLDDTIALHQRKLAKLKELKQGYLQKLFPKNGSKFPQLRFAGFADDWEERKLGDTETHFTDGNYGESYPSAKDMSDKANGIPFLRGSDFSNGYLDPSNANYIKPEKHAELTSGHIKQDDIVLVVRGSLGTLGYATKENEGWNINSQLAILRTNKSEISGMFLIQYLLGSKGQKEIFSRNTGTALKQLPIKQLKDIPVPVPTLLEQQKIGNFFKELDSTIALHQRKLDLLKEQKKGFLQNMFV